MGVKAVSVFRGQEHLWRCGTWEPRTMYLFQSPGRFTIIICMQVMQESAKAVGSPQAGAAGSCELVGALHC